MSFKKTLEERLQESRDSREQLHARIKAQAAKTRSKAQKPPDKVKPRVQEAAEAYKAKDQKPTTLAPEPIDFQSPRLASIDGSAELYLTPWAVRLATTLRERALDSRISLRLVWPADIDTAVTLHAVASLSAVLSTHLLGLRTLYYPGTDATWATLDRITTDRKQYDQLCKNMYNKLVPKADSNALRVVLDICHEANYAKRDLPLRIRQLIPAFRYDRTIERWVGVREPPIDALIMGIANTGLKKQLRERIAATEWNSPASAPGSLLVLHREIKKKGIKSALVGTKGGAPLAFDAVLIDASTRQILADPDSVKAIPKHLETIYETCHRKVGTLIVTNDPAEFRNLGRSLEKLGFAVDSEIIAAEATGTDWLASGTSMAPDWKPDSRTMVNFKIKATDEQAAQLARRIRRIVDAVHEEGAEVEEPFIRAQHLVLRASLVPGGLSDASSSDQSGWSPLVNQLDLQRIEALIQEVLTQGGATSQRKQISEVLADIRTHLAACADATPLAAYLKSLVERHVIKEKGDMTVVIFSRRDTEIAQQYLARTLAERWDEVSGRVKLLSLSDAATGLPVVDNKHRLIIVGLNPKILRFLVTRKDIPLHTSLLVPTHQAARMLSQIQFLSSVDVLKVYRGRLVELKSHLESSLGNVPDIESIVRAYDTRLPASAHQSSGAGAGDPAAYRLFLDDDRCISVSGSVFRYAGLDDAGFHRVSAKDVHEGDSVFAMSDDLRDEVETVLATEFSGGKYTGFRSALDGYRAIMEQAIESKYPRVSVAERISAIQLAMGTIEPAHASVSNSKLRYWLSPPNQAEDETAPHFARDKGEYLSFCRSLSIPEAMAEQFWSFIRKVRVDNQQGGRQLTSLYAEVLLDPDSSKIYRGIKPETIQMLQSKALDCVAQVVRIEPPAMTRMN